MPSSPIYATERQPARLLAEAGPGRVRGGRVGWLARWAVGVGVIIGAYLVLSARRQDLALTSRSLQHLHWPWVLAAVAAEAASVVAFAATQRRLLKAGGVEVGMAPLTGITLVSYSMQNCVPGGVVLGGVYSFRQFHRRGADDVLAGWTLLAATALSELALVALAGVGLVLDDGTDGILGVTGVVAILLVFGGLVAFAWSRRDLLLIRLLRPVRFVQHLVNWPRDDAAVLLERLGDRAAAIVPRPHEWAMSATWALANWVFDAACLAFAFVAVGARVPWHVLLLAYAATQLAASVPITPGGLGVIEGGLAIALVASGGAEASTVAAVLCYRLISYWAMLPAGWVSWALLRRSIPRETTVATPAARFGVRSTRAAVTGWAAGEG